MTEISVFWVPSALVALMFHLGSQQEKAFKALVLCMFEPPSLERWLEK